MQDSGMSSEERIPVAVIGVGEHGKNHARARGSNPLE